MNRIVCSAQVIVLMALLTGCRNQDPPDLSEMKEKILRDYPSVSHVSTEQVEAWLDEPEKPILLDVREEAEFLVSHLEGARHAPPGTEARDVETGVLANTPKDARVVCYCSVGVRSSIMAEKLKGAGFRNVHSMNGSIFEWANRGLPVFKGDREVREVHPYNAKWGKLLVEDRRAGVPPID